MMGGRPMGQRYLYLACRRLIIVYADDVAWVLVLHNFKIVMFLLCIYSFQVHLSTRMAFYNLNYDISAMISSLLSLG